MRALRCAEWGGAPMDEASKRAVLVLVALAYAALALGPLLCAVILLLTAETWRGRLYAVAALCLLALPPLALRARVLRRRAASLLAGAVAAMFAALVAGLY